MLLKLTRLWLPLAIAAAGLALIIAGHGSLSTNGSGHALLSASGVALVIVAMIVWMVNWMYRMSIDSNREREREEEAREYFDRHGRWPGE